MTFRPRAYFAAPLFNQRERDFNLSLAEKLEPCVSIFLPQRDGSLLVDMVSAGVPLSVAQRRVFDQDRAAMANSDLMIAVLDGAHIDEGVAFEIGYMHGIGKVCVGLQSDVRRQLPTGNNPMIESSLEEVFSDEEALLEWVFQYTQILEELSRASQ